MSTRGRWVGLTAAILTAAALAGCGGSSAGRRASRPTVATVLMASAPNSLDPAVGDNPEALEADYVAYTPLLTFFHFDGVPGTRTIPGLAEAQPTISDEGKTYTLTLLPGLLYSDGQPVKAGDFSRAVERAVKLWPRAGELLTNWIVGARAFAAGRAKTISGITADDAARTVTIHLTTAYGQFDDLLALPVLAPVPSATPLRDEPTTPPPGVGIYKFGAIVPGKSFSMIKNAVWSKLGLPYLPTSAHLDLDVRITGNAAANAKAVLDNSADVFDWPETIPADLLPEVERTARKRYARRAMNGTYVAFLNVTSRPFSSQLVRQAVRAAVDQNTLAELDSGKLEKGCYVLPPGVYGHPGNACPEGNRRGDGNLPLARALVQRSGMAGSAVTVWTPAQAPAQAWMTYYTSLLDGIGLNARLKVVPAGGYYRTIGDLRLHPQTGFGEYDRQIPYPAAFYDELAGSAIQPTDNRNWGEINDPYINRTVQLLGEVPAAGLDAVSSFWSELEQYTAQRAYVAVLGYRTAPELVSRRIDFSRVIFNPVVGYDWSSLRFK